MSNNPNLRAFHEAKKKSIVFLRVSYSEDSRIVVPSICINLPNGTDTKTFPSGEISTRIERFGSIEYNKLVLICNEKIVRVNSDSPHVLDIQRSIARGLVTLLGSEIIEEIKNFLKGKGWSVCSVNPSTDTDIISFDVTYMSPENYKRYYG